MPKIHESVLLRALAIVLLVVLMAAPAVAQREGDSAAEADSLAKSPPTQSEAARRSREERAKPLVYRPPRRGSPRERIGGSSRAASTAMPHPLALAPEHVALTTRSAPSLFWHLDGAAPEHARLVFTLILADGIAPVVERELPLPASSGVQRIRLADFGVTLDPDVEYEWSVSLVPQDGESDQALVSERYLRRVDASALEGQAPSARAYAEQGLWYDALEALADALDGAPGDPALLAQRDSLLRQAGLESALSAQAPN